MPECLECECGSIDFFVTPTVIMCQRCVKKYTIEDIIKMQKKYINKKNKG